MQWLQDLLVRSQSYHIISYHGWLGTSAALLRSLVPKPCTHGMRLCCNALVHHHYCLVDLLRAPVDSLLSVQYYGPAFCLASSVLHVLALSISSSPLHTLFESSYLHILYLISIMRSSLLLSLGLAICTHAVTHLAFSHILPFMPIL